MRRKPFVHALCCASVIGVCCLALRTNSGRVRAAEPARTLTGVVISDIHFDPTVKVLKLGADSNRDLMESALSEARAKSPALILYTGDMVGHNVVNGDWNYENALVEKQPDACRAGEDVPYANREADACAVVEALQKPLASTTAPVPVVIALGNNDAAAGDYEMRPNDPMFTYLADKIDVIRNATDPEVAADFRYGGFYAVPDPTVPNQEILVLNTDFWTSEPTYTTYEDWEKRMDPHFTDPGQVELWWLAYHLNLAREQNHRVRLVMHIPPGVDAYQSAKSKHVASFWQKPYLTGFLTLMRQFEGTVGTSFAAHTHQDEFRVISDAKGNPFLAIRVSPSVSPSNYNNPAYSVFTYDGQSGEIEDIATYFKPLSAPTSAPLPVMPPDSTSTAASSADSWRLEYLFSTEYQYPADHAYNAKNLADLARRIGNGPSGDGKSQNTAFTAWQILFNVSGSKPEFSASDATPFAAAQMNLTDDAYSKASGQPLPSTP